MFSRKVRVALVIDYITSDYSNTIINGIKAACQKLDIDLLIFSIGELHSLHIPYDYQNVAITSFLSKKNLDGLIFETGSQLHSLTKAELTSYLKSYKSLPMINIASELNDIPSIFADCYSAYKELLTHLVKEQNSRKFVVIGAKSNSADIKNRRKYIKQILEELNIPSKDISYWNSTFDYGNTLNALEMHYKESGKFDYDTIIALNDEMAFACLDFCKQIGKKVPKDVIVVGFDDLDRSASINPSLTSINQRIFEQGYKSVELLNDLMQGREIPKVTVIDAKSILRKSSLRNNVLNGFTKNNQYLTVDRKMHSEENYSLNEWYSKKSQFYQITSFYTEMQSDMTMANLQRRINNDLKSFGVTSCAIVIYGTPIEMNTPFDYFNLPHKAFVFSAFDYATEVDYSGNPEKIIFDPNKTLLPDNLIKFDSQGSNLMAIYHNTLQYGYIIYRPGTYSIAIYDLLSKIVSTIIASVYSYDLIDGQRVQSEAAKKRLNVVASTDELTGLKNRRGLFDIGEETLRIGKNRGHEGLVVYCDIDGLKKINDTFGHEMGDRAIIAESIILSGNFRSEDLIARVGGDEFVIIAPGLKLDVFKRIKEKINEDCDAWSRTGNSGFELSISMGAVEYPSKKSNYNMTGLLSEADHKLYKEKHLKKSKND
ncbi:MAG: GGDEF domain-containing protein [Treponema sp.]|nr:GGDEF domain-containing protein [Treponema sp.]